VDIQRITLVGVERSGPDDPSGWIEACEVHIGPGGDISAEDAVTRVLSVVKPAGYVYEDSRRHTNWGATGLEAQEILILYAIAVAGEVTAELLLKAVGQGLGAWMGAKVDNADSAWDVFEKFLLRAFKLPNAKLVSATKSDDDWILVASAHGRKYEGRISHGGHVVQARRIDK